LLQKLELQPLTADQVRELRALEVLERIGTPAALEVAAVLATGATEARLTQDARVTRRRAKGCEAKLVSLSDPCRLARQVKEFAG
jgi:hypothetical protein